MRQAVLGFIEPSDFTIEEFNLLAREGIGIRGQSAPILIDVKPNDSPNSINCTNNNGNITVAVLTTDIFDATTVNHASVTFEGARETHVDKKSGESRRHEEDVDGDGDTDLVLHFRLGDTGLTCESTEGTLIGETIGIKIRQKGHSQRQ